MSGRSSGTMDAGFAQRPSSRASQPDIAYRIRPRSARAARAVRSDLLLFGLLAADGLQLGEHGIDIEVVAVLFGNLDFGLLARGLRRRQERGTAVRRVDRLLLGRALHLEIEFDL